MSAEYQRIPREVNGQVDLNTVYVAAGDEFRVTVSSRMRAMGIPNSRWMPVTSAMVGKLIGAEIDPCIEIRRQFTGKEEPAFELPPRNSGGRRAMQSFYSKIWSSFPEVFPPLPRS